MKFTAILPSINKKVKIMIRKIRKVLYIILAFTVISGAWAISSQPLFKNFNDNFEIYLNEHSSNAAIISSDAGGFIMTFTRTGESCKTDLSAVEIFSYFGAETVFTEVTCEGVGYYGFSEKIKYREYVNGKTVNLHVFEGKTGTTVGSPLIYGSF